MIISTVSFAEHCSTLAILLTVLDDLGMSLRHDKCEFTKSSIGFLGFRLDGQTIKPSLKTLIKSMSSLFQPRENFFDGFQDWQTIIGVSSKGIQICANH